MPQLPDFEAWAIFAKVAERGSFSRAAADLGLAKTTVSKAVSRLEARLAASLFHRTTRKLSLTESGRLCLARATRMLGDGIAVEEEIAEASAEPRGLVRLAAIAAVGTAMLAPVLPRFLRAYPEIELDLVLTENQVDVVAEGFDAAIQVGVFADSTLRASRLSTFRRQLVAAPSLIARLGLPESPEALTRYPAIVASHIPNGHIWEFHRGEDDPVQIRVHPRFRANHTDAMRPLLSAGIGIGMMPEIFVRDDFAEGRLVELLPEWRPPPTPLYLVTPPGRAHPARVRVLLDFLRAELSGSALERGAQALVRTGLEQT